MKFGKLYDFVFIVLLTTICHLLFSKYGFNPTDEGFVLSASNRILHGQIPHLDFSSLRPLGYAYFHIPELLFFKKHTFLFSRFIFWLEQVLIAFFWVAFMSEYLGMTFKRHFMYIMVLCCLILNLHYFPCSVLHTIDGLLFAVLGFYGIQKNKILYVLLGALCIGFSVLCKQGFLVLIPLSFVLFWEKRRWLWVSMLPSLLYVALVYNAGGWQDLKMQLSGHTEILEVGFFAYVLHKYFWIGVLLCVVVRYLKLNQFLYLAHLILVLWALVCFHYHGPVLFYFSGYLITEIGIALIHKVYPMSIFQSKISKDEQDEIIPDYNYKIYEGKFLKVAVLVFALMWCVSISVGYNTPALFMGGLFAWIIFYLNFGIQETSWVRNVITSSIYILPFIFARYDYIYRDANVLHLDYKLDGVVDGASGIYTNKNTYGVLKELDSLRQHSNTVFLPDFTACFIHASHLSPIGTEWSNKTEIPNEDILNKVITKLNTPDSTRLYAIAKYQTALLVDTFLPITHEGKDYPIIKWVKGRTKKVGETRYFELWK